MQIRRSVSMHGNLLPAAYNTVRAIPPDLLFHVEHGMRHPMSAYGTSLRHISAQWVKFSVELDHLRNEYFCGNRDNHFKVVVGAYAELLCRLNEHLDACYAVIRCVCPASMAKSARIDSQFLGNANPPGWKQFQASIRPYREDHIGLLVNTLKHKQGELCPIYFKSISEFRPGYYLRDILPGGALGPSAKLHSDGNTAFSFARDSLIHLWWIYRIGELLSKAVETIVSVKHQRQLSFTPESQSDSNWDEVLNACAKISPEFFPDEVEKPYPRVILQNSPRAVLLEFPATVRGIPVGTNITVSTMMVFDGAYPINKVPYLANDGDLSNQ